MITMYQFWTGLVIGILVGFVGTNVLSLWIEDRRLKAKREQS